MHGNNLNNMAGGVKDVFSLIHKLIAWFTYLISSNRRHSYCYSYAEEKGKEEGKKKSSKSSDERQTSMQVGGIPNRTMIQHMASETLSVAGSSRSGISSRERVRIRSKYGIE